MTIMHNKINKLTLAVALVSSGFAGQALAGAFQLNEQSVSGQGSAFAGRTSNVTDATIVFGNPAGMSFLDRAQLSAGATYLDVNTDIKNASGAQPAVTGIGANGPTIGLVQTRGSNDGDMVPGTAVPFGYYVQPLNDRMTFGFGVYAPFGQITDYESGFQGRYFGNRTEIEVITAQPTLSYRFNDQFSVGVGVTYNRMEGQLDSRTPNPLNPTTAGDGSVKIDGDDEAWGYNIGLIYRPIESTTLGLTYRSKVEYELSGDIDFSNVYGMPAAYSTSGSLDLTLPETVDFSITHKLDDRWTVMAGAAFVRWSRFDKIVVENEVRPIEEAQSYENAWQFAVGAAYQLNPQWVLRTGLAVDESPIPDDARTVRVPSTDRTAVSFGAGWTPMPDMTIDLAYTYLWEDTAPVSQTDEENGYHYQADYENSAHGFGAQMTYRF
ncbi:outer membrane protein transport protein [Halomonas shantousis]